MHIKIFKHEGFYKAPYRAHRKDVGGDVYATKDVIVVPGCVEKMSLGFGVEVPNGYTGLILPRSGQGAKGLIPAASPIDPGYTGAIHAILTNVSNEPIEIKRGDRIAQLVIQPVAIVDFYYEDEDEEKERGAGAFNSTGKR